MLCANHDLIELKILLGRPVMAVLTPMYGIMMHSRGLWFERWGVSFGVLSFTSRLSNQHAFNVYVDVSSSISRRKSVSLITSVAGFDKQIS
jgi:hypothetical protein